MTESFASSHQAQNTPFQGASANTDNNHNTNNNNRKQKRRPMQANSQENRQNYRTYQQQQQQQQQQWYQPYAYYDEYFYGSQVPRGGHNNHNRHQQRRSQYRQGSASSQTNQQLTVRPNSNTSTRSTNEAENLRSTLTEQLYKDHCDCMICIVKIEYVLSYSKRNFSIILSSYDSFLFI